MKLPPPSSLLVMTKVQISLDLSLHFA
ncbi:hypothetical protein Patl1_11120 [Pistacia atlantica]|uniref:Uncharacterized protein n=1 Tax=Pistacia atlantica TaxID=434234 RepID=A0ACC1A8Q3_9ROSI|nr:hypothetical protein Patl1_11120 [Pistacia atlantica]